MCDTEQFEDEGAGLNAAPKNASVVLVVDDEPRIRDIAASILEANGIPALKADNGATAVDVFRENAENVGVVLLDVTMPKMDGTEALHRMREIQPGVRVVLSSGQRPQDLHDRHDGVDADGFLKERYEAGALLETIQGFLREA